jgi:hypothetical protein
MFSLMAALFQEETVHGTFTPISSTDGRRESFKRLWTTVILIRIVNRVITTRPATVLQEKSLFMMVAWLQM